MKKVLRFLTLAAMLCIPWVTQAQATLVQIGDGTATTNKAPIGTYYNYSITEQMYTASEIGTAGSIQSIGFYYMGIAAKNLPITVYMKNEDAADLSTGISLADADQVFSGNLSVTTTAGWVTITLDTPFEYDGTSNLLIGIIKDYLYYFNGQSWQGTSVPNMARYSENDNNAYTTSTVPGTALSTRPNIQISIIPGSGSTCEKPATFEVTSVTTTGATLTWAAGSGHYNVEYKTAAAANWTSHLSNTDVLTSTLTGLTPATDYQVRVQSVCGGETSGWKTANFTTECDVINTFPWSENFESYASGNFTANCWVNEHISGDGTQIFKVYTSTNGTNSTHQLQLPDMSSGTQTKLVLPVMTLPGTNYLFSIDVYRVNATSYPGEGVRVYASTDGEIAGATELAFISRNYSTSDDGLIPAETAAGWYTYELPIGISGTCYIILRGESKYGSSTYMDNFVVKEMPSCLKPTLVTCTATTTTSATLSWTAGDPGDDAWQISYKTGTDEWSTPADITTNPYTLTGLAENTTYDVRVRTNCGDGEENKSEWTATVTFTTPCAAITVDNTHPYTVDLRASTIADCWSQTDGTYPWSFSSTNGATFSTSSYSEQTSTKLVSPLFDFGAGDNWMSFTGKLYGYEDDYWGDDYTATLKVYYRTSPSGAWQELAGQSYSATGETENLNVEEVMLPAGTCQLAFEATTDYSSSYAYTYLYSFAVEKVPSCFQPRNLTHSDVTARTATVTWERHPMGTEGAWDLQLATNNTFTEGLQEMVVNTTPSKALTGLTPVTHYFVRVKPACDDAGLLWSSIDDFTTLAACLVPTALTVDDITNHTAEVTWTGTSDSYNVKYRSAAYVDGIEESFGTSLPSGWENKTGLLSNVMTGTALSSTTQWSFGTSNGVFDNHARINIYGTSRYGWLITPQINLSAGATMNFDLALTAYSGTGAAATTGTDDRFVVLISTDDMATWTILREWNNDGSGDDVYNNIATTGENVNIDLSAYDGQTVRIAFYGESTVSNADNNLHIDNVAIGTPVAASSWTEINNYALTTVALGSLDPSTPYEVQVQGNCGGDGLSEWSDIVNFTTTIPCPAPTALAYSELKSTQVDLTWTSFATAWQVAYKADADGDFTIVDATTNPFTLDGLVPETHYTVKVLNNCEASYPGDGVSEWTSTIDFTTLESCAQPTGVTASDITNTTATISWTGDAPSFTVKYRIPAYIDGVEEHFPTTSIPTGWTRYSTLLDDDVLSGTTSLASTTSGWNFSTGNGVFDNHAKVNIYSTNAKYWLVSPETALHNGAALNFDLALTKYSGTLQPVDPTEQADDRFVVLISTDNMTTWTILHEWNNDGSGDDVYNDIACSADGENVNIDLSAYVGQTVRIAFYGESTAAGGDNNLHIDNVAIGTPVAAGAWQSLSATPETHNTITNLAAETEYEVIIEPSCNTSLVSDVVTFTTEAGSTKNISANQWYAISSPMHNSSNDETLAGVTNLIPEAPVEYDLLRWNEATGTWQTSKPSVFTSLERARGYIYRRSADAQLTYVGQRNTGSVNRSITHSCGDVNIKGFNLIGNPYDAAYAPTRAFYTLQANGTWMVHTASPSNKVAAGEGFFIYDNSNATTYVFAEPSGAKGAPRSNAAAIAFSVNNDDFSDVAYATFDDGEGMPKMAHLNSEAPALSIPQGDRRYAIANLDENTESFPLHFSGFGEYTFSLIDNSLGLGYLHLIDRETGADVDMLRQSGYTFSANGNESERFVVLLRPTADANSFVRVSDSRLIIDGEGELQVFDVMGRQLGSAQVSGTTTLDRSSLGIVNAGVYVMRLDGNSQKIVVK